MRDLPQNIEDSIRLQMWTWVRNWRSDSGSNYGAQSALARELRLSRASMGKILGGGISFRTAVRFFEITGQDRTALFPTSRGEPPT
jgi:hypothetical protein